MHTIVPNTCYHIFNHANGLENIYREEKNYWIFMEKYTFHISPIAETYAWCLMPNHFHIVIRLRKREAIVELIQEKKKATTTNSSIDKNSSKVSNFGRVQITDDEIEKFLSKQFANLFSSYTQSFNKVYHRMGSLFIKNFKREPIYDKTHFLNAIVYVHRNPIHHGFCNDFADWPHCSYKSILSGDSRIVQTEKLLKMTGGLDSFKNMHSSGLERLVNSTHFDII